MNMKRVPFDLLLIFDVNILENCAHLFFDESAISLSSIPSSSFLDKFMYNLHVFCFHFVVI